MALHNIIHNDLVSGPEPLNAAAGFLHIAEKLVAKDDPRFRVLPRRDVENVQVASADTGGAYPNQYLVRMGDLRLGDLFHIQDAVSLKDGG
jgi:hypothetical protein